MLLIVLTAVNSGLLFFPLAQPRPAAADGVAPVLRGRAFEIVDDHGRVRASISVLPGDPKYKMPDGTMGFPETVLFRLINAKGQPNVKIESTDGGSAMGLVGEAGNALIEARGAGAILTVHNKDGRQQMVKP
ncbi:MAG TPA: hypothetical protein VKR61_24585 [Bryobacteraceae bacterium]|nr:hypothetical protein [Bryobacteraceae bacterium]